MTELALSVRAIGKAYSRQEVSGINLFRRRSESDIFWALRGVSVDVPKGTGLGIIGGNGAGKSTLLKILARIVLPTVGEVEVHGKVNSLLEVGTGFQPDLSGRDNIYLNGSILGMSRREVDSVFDEIVDFSGIGEFIDMPVKHYSSGMYSRLAFSVAANVTGDILLVDEVLAVGDAEFRKRCLARMNGLLTSEHRTVLFVSHSMESVLRFCTKALWLDRGRVRAFGDSEDVVKEYLRQANRLNASYVAVPVQRSAGTARIAGSEDHLVATTSPTGVSTEATAGFAPIATITAVRVAGETKTDGGNVIKREETISVSIHCEIMLASCAVYPVIHLVCLPRAGVPEDTHVFTCVGDPLRRAVGLYKQEVRIPHDLLTAGRYTISVALVTRAKPLIRHCKLDRVVTFQVISPLDDGKTFLFEELHGVIQPRLEWNLKTASESE